MRTHMTQVPWHSSTEYSYACKQGSRAQLLARLEEGALVPVLLQEAPLLLGQLYVLLGVRGLPCAPLGLCHVFQRLALLRLGHLALALLAVAPGLGLRVRVEG